MIIDDDPQVCGLVAQILRGDGWAVREAFSQNECLEALAEKEWDLIVCDVMLGDSDGYATLVQIRERGCQARFVLMTGQGSAAGALDATAIGAYDYLVKPFTIDDILKLAHSVQDQLRLRSLQKEKDPQPISNAYVSDIPLIGKSPRFVECLKMVGRISGADVAVLVTGESGTGKEVVAKAIHLRSKRKEKPFIAVNCGAIPEDLIESELFGHAKGSFTGADRERPGLWEEADGGTMFLDEITETSHLFQVKLLRALQEGEIRRVGSNRSQKVDVRVIAASNRKIEDEVAKGTFRQDLMYRLNAVSVELPPLRERREDISLLANHFLGRLKKGSGRHEISDVSVQMMEGYNWPGNIRELENAILHAVSLSDGTIYPEHLPRRIQEFQPPQDQSSKTSLAQQTSDQNWVTLAEMEADYVKRVLEYTANNKQAASRILNIDRKTLTRILEKRAPASE